MVEWPRPGSVKALRGYLCFTCYYTKYVVGYAAICRPLIDLLKKDSFKWSEEVEQAFLTLNSTMTSTPVLILPDYSKELVVETDASHSGNSIILMQEE